MKDISEVSLEYIDEEIEAARNDYFEEERLQAVDSKPRLVFKYKSITSAKDLARVCDIFTRQRIYMPTMEQLNDPLESRNSILLGIDESERNEKLKNTHVLSLSADPLLPTMWAYYADNYKGLCIGFKTTDAFSSIEKVEYIGKQKGICWDTDFAVSADINTKSVAWQHENEYRIVRKTSEHLTFNSADVACVLFGCRMEEEIRNHIEAVIPKSIPRFTVKPDETKFCLFADAETRVYNVEQLAKILDAK